MTTNKPEVKRYNMTTDIYGHPAPYEAECGPWVKYRSYKALQAECEKLRVRSHNSEPFILRQRAEAVEESIVVALRSVGNVDPFEVDIYKFAKDYADRIRQKANELEKAYQSA